MQHSAFSIDKTSRKPENLPRQVVFGISGWHFSIKIRFLIREQGKEKELKMENDSESKVRSALGNEPDAKLSEQKTVHLNGMATVGCSLNITFAKAKGFINSQLSILNSPLNSFLFCDKEMKKQDVTKRYVLGMMK